MNQLQWSRIKKKWSYVKVSVVESLVVDLRLREILLQPLGQVQKSKWSTGNSFSNVGKVLSSTLLFFLPLFLRAKEGKRQITLLCFACINSWNCWGGMTRVIYALALLLMFRFLSWQNSILKIASPGSKVLSVPAFSSSWRSLWFHRFTLWTWTCFLSSAQAHTPSEVAPAASRSPVASRSLLWRRFDGGGEATLAKSNLLWRRSLTRGFDAGLTEVTK